MQTYFHEAVLLKEVLGILKPRPGDVVLDGTVGAGGHAVEIMKRIIPGGLLIGIDRDEHVLRRARDNLSEFELTRFCSIWGFRRFSSMTRRGASAF